MEETLIKQLFIDAVIKAYQDDIFLISHDYIRRDSSRTEEHVGERAIVFRIGHYFQNMLTNEGIYDELTVDCEYNRHHTEVKRVDGSVAVYPDLILHKRNSDSSNILVSEFKGYWVRNEQDWESKLKKDIQKIKNLCDICGEYKYKIGAIVYIHDKYPFIYFYDSKNKMWIPVFFGKEIDALKNHDEIFSLIEREMNVCNVQFNAVDRIKKLVNQ